MAPRLSAHYVVLGLLLSACGGGGGDGNTLLVSAGSNIPTGRADLLFSGLTQTSNLADTAYVVDTDSGQVRLFSDKGALDRFLAKQPEPRFFSGQVAAGDVARGVFIPASSSAVSPAQSHGKFMIWGRALTALPNSLNTRSRLDYRMTGSFHCQSCPTKRGALTGSLTLQLDAGASILRLSGGGLVFSQHWQLGKNASLAVLGKQNASLTIGNQAQNIMQLRGHGGLFGAEAQSAGMVFSMDYETPSGASNQTGVARTGRINALALGNHIK